MMPNLLLLGRRSLRFRAAWLTILCGATFASPAAAGPLPAADPVPFPFYGVREYPVGGTPRQSAAGDFDEDGWPDVATVRGADASVSVMLNRGDGDLLPGVLYAVGGGPLRVIAKDVDQDTHLDLLVQNTNPNASLLLGNGDGTFQPATLLAASRIDVAPALADVDANGTEDLLTFTFSTHQLSLQRGNGDGTFQAPEYSSIAGVGSVYDLAVGDFDGNASPDIAFTRNQHWYVYLNDGNGVFSFASGEQVATTGTTKEIETADLDGDGHLDLVVAIPAEKRIEILTGQGDGTFSADTPLTYTNATLGLNGNPDTIGLADLTGDGRPELFVGLFRAFGGSSQTRLIWHVNTSVVGDPGFGLTQQSLLVDAINGLAFADLDRDGVANVITGGGNMDPLGPVDAIAVFAFRAGPGVLELEDRQRLALFNIISLEIGQLVGSPAPELVFAIEGQTWDWSAYAENLGGGVFSTVPQGVLVVNEATDVAVGEFDPDNLVYTDCPDLMVGGGNQVGYMPGNCSGGFVFLHPMLTGFHDTIDQVEAVDINRDGHADLIFGGPDGLAMWPNNGEGVFEVLPFVISTGNVSDLTMADMDLDGDFDFVSTEDDTLLWVRPSGWSAPHGMMLAELEFLGPGNIARALAVGDFDADGFPDVAVATARAVLLFRNQQDGTLLPDGSINAGIWYPNDIAAGDVDGDGRDDLAVLDSSNGRENVSVFVASESGGFETPYRIITGLAGYHAEPKSVAMGDLNDDGLADIAVGSRSGTAIATGTSVYLSRGPFVPVPEPGASVGMLAGCVAIAGLVRRRRARRRADAARA